MNRKQDLLTYIRRTLSYLQTDISNSNGLRLYDGNIAAEDFYCKLLNLIFGYSLKTLDDENKNFPDIDLIDRTRKLAVQVTSDNGSGKIKKTIKGFYSRDGNDEYELWVMLISKEAKDYEADFADGGKYSFDKEQHIKDIPRLLAKMKGLEVTNLERIAGFFTSEVPVVEQNGVAVRGTSASANASIGNIIIQNIIRNEAAPEKSQTDVPSSPKFYPTYFLPDLKYFVGRKELLANLGSTLEAHHKASIHDISGLGKTFVCYKFAADNQQNYSRIFFVNCAKEAMMGSLAGLGLTLDPSVKGAPQEKQAEAFRNWLETNPGWLAIYDNVDEPAALKPFIPNNENGNCLFTSNDSKIKHLGKEVFIDTLEIENAAKLLFRRANADTKAQISFAADSEQAAFWQIVENLDGLPVALNTTGAFIEELGISYSEYLENLKASPDLNLEHGDDFDPYKKTILAAFALAINANTDLDDKFTGEAVDELYRAASLIAPDDIPEEFLRAFLEANNGEFAASAQKNILWQRIRMQFQGFDLFKYDPLANSFSTHRLIQKCVQSRLVDAKAQYCEKVLNLLVDFFPKYEYDNKVECERYYQHTLTALENGGKGGLEAGISKSLYYRVARYQEMLGSYGQAMEFYQKDLEISRKVYGEVNEETAASLNNLSNISYHLGRLDDSIAFRKAALEINKNLLGENSFRYAIDLNNLATVYRSQGKHNEAMKLYKQAIKIEKKTIGRNHPDYASALNNLAGLYKDLGKYDEAIKFYKEAIEIRRQTLGKDHPDYAQCLNNLAIVYDRQDNYDEAIRLYKEATEVTRNALGEEHPSYATRLNNLAVTYFKIGKRSEALPLFEEALRIYEAKLPPEHPSIAEVKIDIGYCKKMLNSSE